MQRAIANVECEGNGHGLRVGWFRLIYIFFHCVLQPQRMGERYECVCVCELNFTTNEPEFLLFLRTRFLSCCPFASTHFIALFFEKWPKKKGLLSLEIAERKNNTHNVTSFTQFLLVCPFSPPHFSLQGCNFHKTIQMNVFETFPDCCILAGPGAALLPATRLACKTQLKVAFSVRF